MAYDKLCRTPTTGPFQPLHTLAITSLSEKDQTTLKDKYVLPRNNSERDRLQTQHRLFTEILGGRLIVDKTIRIRPDDRVLDSGTGVASWILDLRESAPETAEFVGIDISSHMFPTDVPSDVKLLEMSSLSLPSDWENSFDFVNQRLLIGAFTAEQWKIALSGYFRVLKPGGVLQLIEAGLFESLHDSDSLPATKLANEFCIAMIDRRGLLGQQRIHQLPTFVKEAGFSDIRNNDYKAPVGRQWGEIGTSAAQIWISAIRSYGAACLAEGGLGVCNSQDDVDGVIDQVAREWDDNPGVFVQMHTITARKPL
ncbi:hypothetical protein ACEPAH_9493 [Sanghuangporus vaninii]